MQVVDEGIVPSGFSVLCQVVETSVYLNCQVDGMSVNSRLISLSYDDDVLGRNITFIVTYSYESCRSSAAARNIGNRIQ